MIEAIESETGTKLWLCRRAKIVAFAATFWDFGVLT